MRLRVDPKGRWHRGHGLWAHDVLAFRESPAAWQEGLSWASGVTTRELTPEEAYKFRRLDQPMAGTFTVADGPPPRRSRHGNTASGWSAEPAAQPGGGAGFLALARIAPFSRAASTPWSAGLPLLGVCGQASGSPPRCVLRYGVALLMAVWLPGRHR